MHDSSRLVLHFHFFLCIAARQKGIDVWKDIECDRVGIDFGYWFSILSGCFDLGSQFSDSASTAAGDSLVARRENASNAERPVQWVEGHECDRSGAVWICDQPRMLLNVIAIYLRNHKRDAWIHSKHRRIIDYDRSGIAGDRHEPPGNITPRAKEGEVNALKGS